MNNETPKKPNWKWLWWLIPPVAILRHQNMKWYVKTPVILICLLVLLISLDLAFAPHRVEEAEAEKVVTAYLNKKVPGETVRSVERKGEGASLTASENQRVVYYRALTDSGLYQLGLTTSDGEKLEIHHAEQLFPIRIDLLSSVDRTKAEVAIWLLQHEKEVGKAQSLVKSADEGLTQVVKTDIGVYEFKVGNQSVYEVNRIDEKESILKRQNEPVLPEEIAGYVKKNEKKVGKLTRVLAYEMDAEKEKYYFRTSTGDFLAEIFDDGQIEIKKRNK